MLDPTVDTLLRLGVGTLAGIAIGINRTRHFRGTGMRTLGLVGLAAALIVEVFAPMGPGDAASRVVQGLLTGIGFLGAGVIVHRGGGTEPRGLTTAAAIWVTAALGAAAGAGAYVAVGATLVIALGLLVAGEALENLFRPSRPDGPRTPGTD